VFGRALGGGSSYGFRTGDCFLPASSLGAAIANTYISTAGRPTSFGINCSERLNAGCDVCDIL
jgi:hypothetical protein